MGERQQDVLRLQPHMIPATSWRLLGGAEPGRGRLVQLSRGGYLPKPWMGDEVSIEVAAHYTNGRCQLLTPPTSRCKQYRAELARIHDTLQQMEDDSAAGRATTPPCGGARHE